MFKLLTAVLCMKFAYKDIYTRLSLLFRDSRINFSRQLQRKKNKKLINDPHLPISERGKNFTLKDCISSFISSRRYSDKNIDCAVTSCCFVIFCGWRFWLTTKRIWVNSSSILRKHCSEKYLHPFSR